MSKSSRKKLSRFAIFIRDTLWGRIFSRSGTSSFPARNELFSCFPYTSCLAGNELVPSMTEYTASVLFVLLSFCFETNFAFFFSFSSRFEFFLALIGINQSIQHETEVEQERLSKMDLISEEICNSLDPQNKDRQVILKTVEGLQDRWVLNLLFSCLLGLIHRSRAGLTIRQTRQSP